MAKQVAAPLLLRFEMFSNFLPSVAGRYPTSIKTLRTLCQQARSLEQIIHSWCDTQRSLLVSKDVNGETPLLVVSFFLRKRLLGSVEIDLEVLLESYKKISPLELNATPDPLKFKERQDRLKLYIIQDSNKNFLNAAPADAIEELILSYAISGYGFAEIKKSDAVIINSKESYLGFLELKLITINPESKLGWTENFLVNRQDVNLLVQAQKALAKGIFH